jgi:branched-chain amino acid transport system ATP-binding protein
MTLPTLLRVRDLITGYGSVPVLHGVSMDIGAGEVVALLGSNGAGKTTTLRAICGSLPVWGGSISFDGTETRDPLFRRCRRGTAYVTEERCVFPSLTTADNLRLGGEGGIDAAVRSFPELQPLLKRKVALLSGGEQQMLALARAMGRKPRLLVVDELSLGLAPLIVGRLLRAVRSAADDGMGVVIVEQYVARALDIADRAYVLRRGRVVIEGTADEIGLRLDEVQRAYLHGGPPESASEQQPTEA